MWSLPRPDNDEAAALDASRSSLRAGHERSVRINAERDGILATMQTYQQHGQTSSLHTIQPDEITANTVTKSDMEYLYTGGLLRVAGGRYIYDGIMGLAPNSRCPYCGHRRVRQLDHFLPKSKYPAFSVTPLNLVPSCSDCNKDKLAGDASQLVDLPLHPYFDDVNQVCWLKSELIEGPTAVFLFNVDQDCGLPDSDLQRLRNQFNKLSLDELYATEANDELAAIRLTLRSLFNAVGYEGVQEYLQDAADSAEFFQRNSWKTSMYRAAAQSQWFCQGGFDDPELL